MTRSRLCRPLHTRWVGADSFTQHVDPSPVTRPPTSSSSRPALLRAVSDPQSAFVAEDVDATSACPIFEHQALQQELPDEFLAMASILGRSYAGSSQSDLRGLLPDGALVRILLPHPRQAGVVQSM